jgi:hypothetical protein
MEKEFKLITVSLESMNTKPYIGPDRRLCQSAIIHGESSINEHSFELKTGLLNSVQLERCEMLRKHGSIVVEAPSDWRDWSRGEWQNSVIQLAMNRVAAIAEANEGKQMNSGYDVELANAVLKTLGKFFPRLVNLADIKHDLRNEPNDDQLLTALDALTIDGLIQGKQVRSGMGSTKLVAMANIGLTSQGRIHLAALATPASAPLGAVFHGDQYVNYGQAGAIGPHSTGTITYQQQWTAIQNEVDPSALTLELEKLKKHLQRNASSVMDFQQLGLLAEAEEDAKKQNGSKVMEVLSKAGKGLLDVAKEISTDLAAKVIAKSLARFIREGGVSDAWRLKF